MIIDPSPQGTPEWLQARAGVVTASCFSQVMAGGKGITRTGYMRVLANEIITGKPFISGFTTPWMEGGTAREPESREFYTFESGNQVDQVGLIYLDELKRIGASVDGLIGDDGQQELKNPKLETHLGYLLDGGLPAAYVKQVQGQLWVTGRQWCDFSSYHPDAFKLLFTQRVERDETIIGAISDAVCGFIVELDSLVETMRKLA